MRFDTAEALSTNNTPQIPVPVMADGLRLSIRADVKKLSRELTTLAHRQLPYATKLALDALAAKGQAAERAAMEQELDKPRAFTERGIMVQRARKDFPVARIFIADIQARYLAPEILGGKQVLNHSRAILKPFNIKLDRYGNIPKRRLAALKARADIFIGPVRTPRGQIINGVWQRAKGRRPTHRLTLLVRFADPVEVKTRYRWGAAIRRVVTPAAIPAALAAGLKKALATAR
jgi:hypothetical protein